MKLEKCFFLVLLFMFFIGGLQAQKAVTVRLKDSNGEAVQGAFVSLNSASEKARKWQKVSDSLGLVFFSVSTGNYRIRVEAYSFEKMDWQWLISRDQDTLIVLVRDAKMMKGVVVTARKPLMRQEDDKTIVDPEPIALGSTHAFEVLEKIPGLFIDQDGNVYLNSTSPSAVWINGREQRMSSADLATMLKSLPPGAIDRVELVRTPSARYDAAGGGGIVNIILKKNVRIGLTGSVNAGFNQGRYGNQFGGFNINHSDGVKSSYLNVNLNARNSFDQINTSRQLGTDSLLQQFSRTLLPGNGWYIGAGMNRELNKRLSFGIESRISLNNSRSQNENPTDIFRKSNNLSFFSSQSNTRNKYVYLSRHITKIAGYELRGYLVYRRSITRPS